MRIRIEIEAKDSTKLGELISQFMTDARYLPGVLWLAKCVQSSPRRRKKS
jgi:hypothetical protein